ncbi:hypothetical protein L226DRAFT_615022 [Lentinus tigrinus ALCF2SS1-7]|uniref:Uncharacterized protein n=1 Tax=Lentinus tigrinus ALCF2SS1-6 TaxID=1328759 RepID=A0A5C2S3B6_9APHY|nr:hypothetical protein L227DRAFT_655489 [Lentinus tigrinus ALCF2SS1-6]RPD71996.1 hypothetical protein L226DRAFT_615022 [Lentinus tigrinus ALCF2SS1-7]
MPPPSLPPAHISDIIKREETESQSSIASAIPHRDHRDDSDELSNVKQEIEDAKTLDVEGEQNIDILRRHIAALREECDTLARERDAALRASIKESGNVVSLRIQCDTLKRERDAAVKQAQKEKEDIEAHVRQYNPEVIERQEELLAAPASPQANTLNNPPGPGLSNNPVIVRMRQGLSDLGVQRGATSNLHDGRTRLTQFRLWLRNRPVLGSGKSGAPGGVSAAFKGSNLPELSPDASRSCKAPPLFVGELCNWNSRSKQLGIVVCPDYVYERSETYNYRVWSRADRWHACGEQEREVFYHYAGEVHYAGTYVCHTGPGMLKVHDIDKVGVGQEDMITRLITVTNKTEITPEERAAVRELYREGTLTAHVLGLERIGFNNALHSHLRAGYGFQQEVTRREKGAAKLKKQESQPKKLTKAQRKAAKVAAKAARQQVPPLPPPVLQPPFVPASFGFNPMLSFGPAAYVPGCNPHQTHEFGIGNGFANPPLPHLRVPSPPRRAPSELEYAGDESGVAIQVKREREDEYLMDGEREYKAAKLEDIEDEQRVDDKLRARTEEPEVGYGQSGSYDDENAEPYLGFKEEE